MLHRSFKPAKCKTSLKLATSRIKLLKNKKEVQLKQLKRELAQLLESGQDQTARIRVEHVVREEKMMAAYDLLAIYCELIAARLPIIESQKNCPIDMKEAVTSVIFASPRCADIPELQDVRKHLTSKYGKEFVNAALELRPECGVSRMLVEKLSAKAPDGQTKIKILTSIAEEHNVKWDPKSFGEKELNPPDDLLNGPNTFDKASKMHPEPPIVQAPPSNIHAPQDHDQEQGAPVNYQQNSQSSTSSHNFAFTGISESQSTTPAAPHPPVRHSGTEYERTEVRHSYSRDENAFSMGKQNWNMEFKDATAAAQAAAESAERASMAARAAAELSSHGKITRQYSTESHNSNADSLRNDKPQKINTSKLPAEKFGKNVPYNVSHDRNQNLHTQTEEVDRYGHEVHYEAAERFYDDHGSTERFSQSASLRSGQASIDDQSSMNNLHEVDRYSRKGSFEKEAVKSEKSASLSGMRANEQSIGQAGLQSDNSDYFGGRIRKQDSNNYSHSNSANYGNDNNFSPPRYQNIVFDVSKDPSVGIYHGNSHRETVESGNTGAADVVFDSYGSDDDEINFDGQPLCDEHESNLNFASLNKEPSKKNMSGPSEKPFSVSHVSAEWFSPPKLGESFTKTPSSAQLDDLVPATFDSGPSSDSEDGFDLSSFHGKTDPGIPSNKENNFFRNSDDISGDHGLKGLFFTEKADSGPSRKQNLHSYYDDEEFVEVTAQHKHGEEFGSKSQTKFGFDEMPSPRSSSVRQNAQITSNDMTHHLSPQSSRLSSVNEVKDTDDMYTSVLFDSIKNEQSFDQSRSESGKELNLASLPGGLRNKGYKHPPYTKISLTSKGDASTSKGDASTSKGTAEDNMTFSEKSPASPTVESSLNSRASPQVKEMSSSRTEIKKHDLSRDDFKEELPQQNLRNKQEPFFTKVDNTKSKFSAPATYFDSDDDFEEDLPKQTSTNKVRAGSGFSRRTKANSVSERSSYLKTKVGSAASESSVSVSKNKLDSSENRPKLMPQTEKHSTTQPIGEENQKSSTMEQPSSPLKTETSSSTGTSKTSSGEAPSRESSLKKASHVHPKLPDYDSIAAQLQSLRQNRR